ncbi:hypothetical protein BCU70_02140 [Vibrio sp. 10N.286.49.C2]|uniref:hypothetical protein n=1 Tax=unclassified Vibrio TaxID=2614977 RepID=UPI000C824C0A|nr:MULTISPECIES: hypothetical protein [unclassified Vibrio]PMH38105.1 hypothetical protein BCU70_02140 [Vibrio sp. 10N.286.49.C2]PMH53689.1 hypothetical protein BCU66_12695 [Vibrio sp. 10N.286.49.B1]PMH81947.1 hypothetical protein BCU58_19815 [Vibrio sp. 10N.286.48.B7]
MRNAKAIALDAIELTKPSIERLFERTNRKELHIVVMDPTIKPWEASFEEAILVEVSLGNPTEWTIPFDELAKKKAHQAWRNSCPNMQLQTQHPSSLREGDVLFYGSFVYGDIVVACSGVEQWYDMLVSSWIALAIEQITISEYQTIKTNTPTQQTR